MDKQTNSTNSARAKAAERWNRAPQKPAPKRQGRVNQIKSMMASGHAWSSIADRFGEAQLRAAIVAIAKHQRKLNREKPSEKDLVIARVASRLLHRHGMQVPVDSCKLAEAMQLTWGTLCRLKMNEWYVAGRQIVISQSRSGDLDTFIARGCAYVALCESGLEHHVAREYAIFLGWALRGEHAKLPILGLVPAANDNAMKEERSA